ncbi:hypothetical protein [Bradyrhizobium sp. SEMIA]|uniref:hypothetical protein n=1 Tax=Bradyrhizobium sp. SEMIA TaxID=2597515 RepID=UPI0018A3A7C2|nr:hypothetical protein [Bradyrhizobium sp. SEMIA]QOG23012.1 hypothetical protein FOM02_42925 [Bradyrhizobium sp. SEMIA]
MPKAQKIDPSERAIEYSCAYYTCSLCVPIHADEEKLKTRDGRSIASTESKELAEQVAARFNEHAYQEEQDRWSA